MKSTVSVFFRQSFTEAGEREQAIVQDVLDDICCFTDSAIAVRLVTGNKAYNRTTFKAAFEQAHRIPFTPARFREKRLALLAAADAFILLRTGMSESTAFEVAYNIYGGRNVPMLYLIWENAPIKTTLIREMEDIAEVTYHTFKEGDDLKGVIASFIRKIAATTAVHSR